MRSICRYSRVYSSRSSRQRAVSVLHAGSRRRLSRAPPLFGALRQGLRLMQSAPRGSPQSPLETGRKWARRAAPGRGRLEPAHPVRPALRRKAWTQPAAVQKDVTRGAGVWRVAVGDEPSTLTLEHVVRLLEGMVRAECADRAGLVVDHETSVVGAAHPVAGRRASSPRYPLVGEHRGSAMLDDTVGGSGPRRPLLEDVEVHLPVAVAGNRLRFAWGRATFRAALRRVVGRGAEERTCRSRSGRGARVPPSRGPASRSHETPCGTPDRG